MSKEILIKKLLDISESIDVILRRIHKIKAPFDFSNVEEGGDLYDAILMRLQMIGEALKKIARTNPEILEKHPDVEWNKIIGLRDVISHDYLLVDEEIIFFICKEKIPVLQRKIKLIMEELNK